MASERQIYEKAPITEAIIDIRVEPRADLNLDTLMQLCEDTKADYPRVDHISEATSVMQIQPGVSLSASTQQKRTGFRSISSDGKLVCQRQLEGFTFSRLAPYEKWEPFRDLARDFWNTYRDATRPQRVKRLAVRYMNRIEIPKSSIELKDYFHTSPEISPELPQSIGGFFMQLQLPQKDIKASAILNQTIVPPTSPEAISVILDINVFREEFVPNDDDELWGYFETLHARKNKIFEACITDKTRELFT